MKTDNEEDSMSSDEMAARLSLLQEQYGISNEELIAIATNGNMPQDAFRSPLMVNSFESW